MVVRRITWVKKMGASLRAPSKIGSFPCGFPSKPTRNPQNKANKRPRVYVWGSERRRVGQPSASMLSLFTHVGVSFFGGSPNLVVVPFGFHVKLKTGYQLSKKGVSASLHGKSADLGQIPGCKRLGCNFQGSMYIIYNIIHKNKCFGRNMSVCTTSFFEKKKTLKCQCCCIVLEGEPFFLSVDPVPWMANARSSPPPGVSSAGDWPRGAGNRSENRGSGSESDRTGRRLPQNSLPFFSVGERLPFWRVSKGKPRKGSEEAQTVLTPLLFFEGVYFGVELAPRDPTKGPLFVFLAFFFGPFVFH